MLYCLVMCCLTAAHTAGLPLMLSRVGLGWSQDERPDAAGCGFGGLVGGTLSSGLNKISQFPRAVIGDIALNKISQASDWGHCPV